MARVEFDFSVLPDHPCLAGHFPGNPIVPGVLVLDHFMRGLRQRTGHDITHLPHVRFRVALLACEQAHVWCSIDGTSALFGVTTQRAGTTVTVAEGRGSLAPVPQQGAHA